MDRLKIRIEEAGAAGGEPTYRSAAHGGQVFTRPPRIRSPGLFLSRLTELQRESLMHGGWANEINQVLTKEWLRPLIPQAELARRRAQNLAFLASLGVAGAPDDDDEAEFLKGSSGGGAEDEGEAWAVDDDDDAPAPAPTPAVAASPATADHADSSAAASADSEGLILHAQSGKAAEWAIEREDAANVAAAAAGACSDSDNEDAGPAGAAAAGAEGGGSSPARDARDDGTPLRPNVDQASPAAAVIQISLPLSRAAPRGGGLEVPAPAPGAGAAAAASAAGAPIPWWDADTRALLSYTQLWRLPMAARHKFVRLQLAALQEGANQDMRDLADSCTALAAEQFALSQLRLAADCRAFYPVVGATLSGLAGRGRAFLDALSPCAVIVEEAAEVLEGQLVGSLLLAGADREKPWHCVLVGDQKQLQVCG